jgi:putative ABC transport system permease protein
LKEGRDFSPEVSNDTLNVIINEEAARQMGLTDPLGHEFTARRDIIRKGKIIGVVKDFHLESMHAPILPLYMFLDTSPRGANITIRTQPGTTAEALKLVAGIFRKYNPEDVFSYSFTAEKFRQQYASEALLEKLADAFSFLAISISCLGLFGLVAFSAEHRHPESTWRYVNKYYRFAFQRFCEADPRSNGDNYSTGRIPDGSMAG